MVRLGRPASLSASHSQSSTRATDRELILEQIGSLRRWGQRVEDKRVASVGKPERDWDRQDVITVNLTRAVQLFADIAVRLISEDDGAPPDTMTKGFDRLHETEALPEALARRRKGAVGFRNVAVHAYHSIDWKIAHSITPGRPDDLRQLARSILGGSVTRISEK